MPETRGKVFWGFFFVVVVIVLFFLREIYIFINFLNFISHSLMKGKDKKKKKAVQWHIAYKNLK